jgi:hypothetical protein
MIINSSIRFCKWIFVFKWIRSYYGGVCCSVKCARSFSVEVCSFLHCYATKYTAEMLLDHSPFVTYIYRCFFTNCSCDKEQMGSGGAINFGGNTLHSIVNCSFSDCSSYRGFFFLSDNFLVTF